VINTVEIAGTLVKDIELEKTHGGAVLAPFTVAIKGVRWDRAAGCDVMEQVFVSCLAWEDVAEGMFQWIKGTVVHVRGQLTQQEITTPDGKKERKTKVRALVVSLIRTPYGDGF
jgi:single-stranded DNA-binding protein